MDFCPGGELFYHLHNLGRLTEDQARFYISEILLGLEYLHSLDIIYRDLKPENILLDLDGHVKITDFGLSKQYIASKNRSYSFCGSPEYMSPEMLQGQGHGRELDFYSLGALLYEMLTGLPPFYDTNKSLMYKNILQSSLTIPVYISKAAKDLLQRLLQKEPVERIGYAGGAHEIKAHPWFSCVSWGKVSRKKTIPPYRPNFRHCNFDAEYTTAPINAEDFEKSRVSCLDNFAKFDYNLDELPTAEVFDISTQSSRHANSVSSQLIEEHNSTKVKLFQPTIPPKVFNLKEHEPFSYYSRHRKFKDSMPVCVQKDMAMSSRNLVKELRPFEASAQVIALKEAKSSVRISKMRVKSTDCLDVDDGQSSANEIPEFLKKIEVSRMS